MYKKLIKLLLFIFVCLILLKASSWNNASLKNYNFFKVQNKINSNINNCIKYNDQKFYDKDIYPMLSNINNNKNITKEFDNIFTNNELNYENVYAIKLSAIFISFFLHDRIACSSSGY